MSQYIAIDPGVPGLLCLLYRLLPLFLSSWCSLVAILLPQGAMRRQSMWRQLGIIFTPQSPPNPFFKFLIMHSKTVALYSFPPISLTFSDLLLSFLFILSTKFSVLYVLLIFPLNETLILPFHLLPNWGEKSLTCQIPEEEGGLACLHLPNQNTTWSKTVSPLTIEVHSALVGLIRCG